ASTTIPTRAQAARLEGRGFCGGDVIVSPSRSRARRPSHLAHGVEDEPVAPRSGASAPIPPHESTPLSGITPHSQGGEP
ncbi:hypothetical protein ACYOEI_39580, partial [Singulisphaera rosea]